MKSYNKDIGYLGEHLAKEFLIKCNYKIIISNYRNRFGEIDLICLSDDILVFTEVKSRYSHKYGAALESITTSKINKIKKLAEFYIYKEKNINYLIRFDVIEVYFNYFDNCVKINHIEDAFR